MKNNVPTESIHISDLPCNPFIGAVFTKLPRNKYILLTTDNKEGGSSHTMVLAEGLRYSVMIKHGDTLATAMTNPQLTYFMFDSAKELFAWLADESIPSA